MVQWGDKLSEGALLFALHISESSLIEGCHTKIFRQATLF
jgi:hypothetical protein